MAGKWGGYACICAKGREDGEMNTWETGLGATDGLCQGGSWCVCGGGLGGGPGKSVDEMPQPCDRQTWKGCSRGCAWGGWSGRCSGPRSGAACDSLAAWLPMEGGPRGQPSMASEPP